MGLVSFQRTKFCQVLFFTYQDQDIAPKHLKSALRRHDQITAAQDDDHVHTILVANADLLSNQSGRGVDFNQAVILAKRQALQHSRGT